MYAALGLGGVGLLIVLIAGPLVYRKLTTPPVPSPATATPGTTAPQPPVTPPVDAPPEVVPPADDAALVEAAVRDKTTVRPDLVQVELAGDWAFADVAEKDAAGNWSAGISLLARKVNGTWQVVAEGDAEVFRHKVPAEVLPALDRWDAGHY
jgi:hypothetical protein